jgi:squalene-associated FAD-dependent desaturase
MGGGEHMGEGSDRPAVIVVGGGLAGLSAACSLAEAGCAVTVLEKRPYLGGKAYSFQDKPSGHLVDNGQHVFMKCCTAYIGFLKRLGVYQRTRVQRRLRVPVIGADGLHSSLDRWPLPSPFHLAPALARYRHLSSNEKVFVAGAALAMRSMPDSSRDALDGETFSRWLTRHRQSAWAIMCFWDVIVVPALNDASQRVSAAQAIRMFQEGFLRRPDAADIGRPSVALSELLYSEAAAYLSARGGRVCLGKNVLRFAFSEKGVAAVLGAGGEPFTAEHYVVALPPREMLALLPAGLRASPFFAPATQLRTSPIVNMHLWVDRPITRHPMAAYLDSDIQWLFTAPDEVEARSERDPQGPQHLVISISGAHEYIDMPKERLYDELLDDLRWRVPRAREANVLGHTIVRERDATFTPEPGSAAWRLPTRTPFPNLFLAGAWTATGWPATMESAVRSGEAAATAVLSQ